MVHRDSGGRNSSVARVLVAAAGWVALAAGTTPWRTGDGLVEIGLSRLLGVRDLGATDAQGFQYVDWVETVHWLDAWLLPVAAVALWTGAVRWRRGGARPEVLFGGAVTLLLGIAAIVLHVLDGEQAVLWYGPHLAIVAGIAGLTGWIVGRRTEPPPAPGRPGEMRTRDALVDLDLDRHATPRLVRLAWALLLTLLVAMYLAVVVTGVFDVLTATGDPVSRDVLAVVGIVAGGFVIIGAALVVARIVAELLVIPFRIADGLRIHPAGPEARPAPAAPEEADVDEPPARAPAREPAPPPAPVAAPEQAVASEPAGQPEPTPASDPVAPPAAVPAPPPLSEPTPESTPRPERQPASPPPRAPEPVVEDEPEPVTIDELWDASSDSGAEDAAEPEPWSASLPPRPPPPRRLEGTADQWYEGRPAGAEDGGPVPEAIGVPEDDPEGHPLRRSQPEDGP